MNKVRSAVDSIVRGGHGFRARQVIQQTGLSRQVVNRQLQRMVLTGELIRMEGPRQVQYRAGPGYAVWDWGTTRGAESFDFWTALGQKVDCVGYVRLRAYGRHMLKRDQARSALHRLGLHRFLVVDFRGIERASDSFLDELFELHEETEAINAPPEIEASLIRIRALRSRPKGRPR